MSRHRAEVVCVCVKCGHPNPVRVGLALDGLTREGDKPEKPRPIGPPIPEELVLILASTINFQSLAKGEYGAWWSALDKSLAPFPNIYIDEQLRKADAWLEANPRRKLKDYRKFLTNWLNRAIEIGARAEARK